MESRGQGIHLQGFARILKRPTPADLNHIRAGDTLVVTPEDKPARNVKDMSRLPNDLTSTIDPESDAIASA